MERFKRAEEMFEIEIKKQEINRQGESFVNMVEKKISRMGKKYIPVIQGLDSDECETAASWLFENEQKLVERFII
jgi:hypothetical protein